MTFFDVMQQYEWNTFRKEIHKRTDLDVENALSAAVPSMDDMMSLLSPAAEKYLEAMAQRSHRISLQRFGSTIALFAPLYVSNVCTNHCVYCGFNASNSIERKTLSLEEAVREGRHVHGMGFRHLLLVSGEAPGLVPVEYFTELTRRLRSLFSSIAVEVYPMSTEDYVNLDGAGVDGLVVFQETYDQNLYREIHPAGRKRDFRRRIETPDRGGQAGLRRLGLGALLGLTDWRVEAFFLGLHARYLLKKYWRSQVTISFPRLRPAAGSYHPAAPVSDVELVQMMTALRILLPDVGLVLSTRETPDFRDHLIPLGVTTMSAGARTEPGGYTDAGNSEPQFDVADRRTPEEVVSAIRAKGYDPVWKDWDASFIPGKVA
jgi:2-iminoacetate synthase